MSSEFKEVHLDKSYINKKYDILASNDENKVIQTYEHLTKKVDYNDSVSSNNELLLYKTDNTEHTSNMVYKNPILKTPKDDENNSIANNIGSDGRELLNKQLINNQNFNENNFSQHNISNSIQEDIDKRIENKARELMVEYMSEYNIEDISRKVLEEVKNTIMLQKKRYGIRS